MQKRINGKRKINSKRILEDSQQKLEDVQRQRKLRLKIFSVFYLIEKIKLFSSPF